MLLIVKFDLHNLYDGVCNLYRYELPCAISLAGAISYTAKLQHETPNIRFMGRPYKKGHLYYLSVHHSLSEIRWAVKNFLFLI